jgi:hypothetical protein
MNNKLATRFTSVVFLTVSKLALNDSRQTHDGVFEAKNAPDMRILVGTVDHLFDDANGLEDSLKAAILDKILMPLANGLGAKDARRKATA